jgi:hypothetical protein
LYFQLYFVRDPITLFHADQQPLEQFPTFLFLGSNVRMELVAFDLRSGPAGLQQMSLIDHILEYPELADGYTANAARIAELKNPSIRLRGTYVSSSVPSTVKCPSEVCPAARACSTTRFQGELTMV